jgi:hypothetical protein
MGKGRAGTMNHDHKRKGTTTLFAAMSVLDGTVIGRNMQRHQHPEFIRFLNAVEREVPAGKAVHAILDNYAAHKHPEVRKWLARHPRWTFHFTPTSASWLNAVERFFATLTTRASSSNPWSICRPPSTASSTITTPSQSPSAGPIGTARALQMGETAGAFAGLGMSLNGILTTILLPLVANLF